MLDEQRVEAALAAVRAGQSEAFRDVVQETAGLLRALVGTCVYNAEAAEEVLQDTYLAIYHQVGRYQPGTHCLAWIKAVARYQALTARKAGLREQTHRGRYQQEVADQLGAALAEQDKQDPTEDRLRRLQHCLAQLPARARELVEQHYFRQQALERVAAQLGMTANAARVSLHRVRQGLARCVAAAGGAT